MKIISFISYIAFLGCLYPTFAHHPNQASTSEDLFADECKNLPSESKKEILSYLIKNLQDKHYLLAHFPLSILENFKKDGFYELHLEQKSHVEALVNLLNFPKIQTKLSQLPLRLTLDYDGKQTDKNRNLVKRPLELGHVQLFEDSKCFYQPINCDDLRSLLQVVPESTRITLKSLDFHHFSELLEGDSALKEKAQKVIENLIFEDCRVSEKLIPTSILGHITYNALELARLLPEKIYNFYVDEYTFKSFQALASTVKEIGINAISLTVESLKETLTLCKNKSIRVTKLSLTDKDLPKLQGILQEDSSLLNTIEGFSFVFYNDPNNPNDPTDLFTNELCANLSHPNLKKVIFDVHLNETTFNSFQEKMGAYLKLNPQLEKLFVFLDVKSDRDIGYLQPQELTFSTDVSLDHLSKLYLKGVFIKEKLPFSLNSNVFKELRIDELTPALTQKLLGLKNLENLVVGQVKEEEAQELQTVLLNQLKHLTQLYFGRFIESATPQNTIPKSVKRRLLF